MYDDDPGIMISPFVVIWLMLDPHASWRITKRHLDGQHCKDTRLHNTCSRFVTPFELNISPPSWRWGRDPLRLPFPWAMPGIPHPFKILSEGCLRIHNTLTFEQREKRDKFCCGEQLQRILLRSLQVVISIETRSEKSSFFQGGQDIIILILNNI